MSQNLSAPALLVCGLMLAAAGAKPALAASDGAAPAASPQTVIVDLTQGDEAQAKPESHAPDSRAATVDPVSGTIFVDLSKGDTPAALPERNVPPNRTPHTRHIDLSNGAELPAPDDAQDDAQPAPEPDNITITADRINDPYEETNRGRFRTHVALHHYVIDPVERAYIYVVPEEGREGVHNFLTNLETPSVLANDLFQGKVGRAENTLSRFVVNSTLGVAGLFDIAGKAGIPYRDNDFGATLATYGVGDYPYLLVPVIGPSNPRDLGGKLVDFFLNPLRWVTLPGGFVTSAGHVGLHELDKRSEDVGRLDALAKTAPDPYAVERKEARERRNAELEVMGPRN